MLRLYVYNFRRTFFGSADFYFIRETTIIASTETAKAGTAAMYDAQIV